MSAIKLIIDGHTVDIVFPETSVNMNMSTTVVNNQHTVSEAPRQKASASQPSVRELFDAFTRREAPYSLTTKEMTALSIKYNLPYPTRYVEIVPDMLYAFRSTNSDKYYIIQYNGNLKRMMCSCPTGFYRFPTSCKHVLKLEETLAAMAARN